EEGGIVAGQIDHGGDPGSVRRRLGLGDSPLLDFSTSLNPLGPPSAALPAAREAIARATLYPEPGCPRLTERLAELHGVPLERVIVAAGTTDLISLLGQSLREVLALHAHEIGDPKMPLSHLVEPTYAEYRRASVLNELRTQLWAKPVLGWCEEFLPRSAAGIFWTGHPNNPTGRAWNRERLCALVDDTLGLLTVVDEAFLPFLADGPLRSLAGDVSTRDNLLVLRSLTKIYAIPGLRVGYAVASPDMVQRLRQYQNPWSVTACGEAAALAALDDDEYCERTREFVAAESLRVIERLWEIPGLRPAWPARERPSGTPPLPNFLLVSLVETPMTSVQAHEALARRGFLVRECSNFNGLEEGALLSGPDQILATRGHLRIGLRSPRENDRLLAALAEVLAAAALPGAR
ncbi:MAG TPA: aminotransferase class I/II-fold pyridoxal phosphate-dependent enzyme, partial [Isosphaeraceae bacterium]|nr:aminotransferase class I/II-fold pyridoxal phosphate-dependent enzyme [Isosphaeraceae bacterium]